LIFIKLIGVRYIWTIILQTTELIAVRVDTSAAERAL
jgi:hypothetical protein